jgi:hypothetical protein
MVANAVNKTSIVCVLLIKVKRFSYPPQKQSIVLRRHTKVYVRFEIANKCHGIFC